MYLRSLSSHVKRGTVCVPFIWIRKPLQQINYSQLRWTMLIRIALEVSPEEAGNSYIADLKPTSALQCTGAHQTSLMNATEWPAVTLCLVTTAAWEIFVYFCWQRTGFVPWFLQQKHLLRSGILICDLQKLICPHLYHRIQNITHYRPSISFLPKEVLHKIWECNATQLILQ